MAKKQLIRANTKTMPDKKTLMAINKITRELFDKFSVRFFLDRTEYAKGSLDCMKHRGKLSQEAATAFCNIPEVKAAGFTREALRPDLRDIDWVV